MTPAVWQIRACSKPNLFIIEFIFAKRIYLNDVTFHLIYFFCWTYKVQPCLPCFVCHAREDSCNRDNTKTRPIKEILRSRKFYINRIFLCYRAGYDQIPKNHYSVLEVTPNQVAMKSVELTNLRCFVNALHIRPKSKRWRNNKSRFDLFDGKFTF